MPQHPTVGDTITIVRRIAAPAGAVIDARPPADSSVATLALPPVVAREGDSVRIAYTLAVWSAGHNDLVLPGPIVVDVTGHVDTLADSHVTLDVASVLPADRATTTIVAKRGKPWIPRADVSPLPFVVLIPVLLAVVVLLQSWWRRRGPPFVVPTSATVAPLTPERVAAWITAGEPRLVLDYLSWLTRERPEFDDWRARAESLRFSAGETAQVEALAREGFALMTQPTEAP